MADIPDMTDKYNSYLPPGEEAKFEKWAEATKRKADLADYDLRGWWKSGGNVAANGHMTDEFKKPNQPTFSTDSRYNGADGAQGGQWTQQGQQWKFVAGPTNLQTWGPERLQDYFARREPGAILQIDPQ